MSTPRSLGRAAAAGAAGAFVVFALLLTYGHPTQLLPKETLGNFYDAQAQSFLHGHLTVAPSEVSFEGFRIGSRTYEYQGPIPALMRLPIEAVTDRFHGRLTRVSMLLADLVALWFLVRQVLETRRIVRGNAPVSRVELGWTALATFGLGTSSILFLASKAWVYHEALLWGTAFSLGCFFHLTALLARPPGSVDGQGHREADVALDQPSGRSAWTGGRHAVLAAVFAGLALLTRSSVGAGPIAGLGLAAVVQAKRSWATRGDRPMSRLGTWLGDRSGWRPTGTQGLAVLALGVVLPVGAYMAVNQAKFGSLVSLPAAKQVLVQFDPAAQKALAENHGSLFSPKFTPSIVLQSVRPDGVSLSGQFPFIGFPRHRPRALNHTDFEQLDWSSSLPSSEPMLVVFSLLGLAALLWPKRVGGRPELASLRIPVAGAAVGGLGFVTIGYMANRYYTDLFPVLALLAVVGIHVAGAQLEGSGRRVAVVSASAGLAALVLWGTWANLGLGLEYQRVIAPGAPAGSRAAWIEEQSRLGAKPPFVRVAPDQPLPAAPRLGELAVVGRCAGLYRSDGSIWDPIEGSDEVGQFHLDLALDSVPAHPVTVLDASRAGESSRLEIDPIGGGRVQFVARSQIDGRGLQTLPGAPIGWGPGGRHHLTITFDFRQNGGYVEVDEASTQLLSANLALVRAAPRVNPTFPGRLQPLTPPRPKACEALTG